MSSLYIFADQLFFRSYHTFFGTFDCGPLQFMSTNSFCNGYTDREESENEKRRKERGVTVPVTSQSLSILPPVL